MKANIRKVLCMLLLLLLPVQVWGAESEPTARNEKLKLDNENRYGDMEKAYQDGYEPEVNGENVSIILPLVLNGKNEVETVTASPDLGDQNTAPFIFQNYQKTFKKTEEKINDTEATKIEGTLKKDVLQKVLAESGMTETAAAMGVTEEQLAALTESVKSLPLTLWIDADGYVLKYEMNLTEVMQKIMDKAMEAAGSTDASSAVKVEKTSISMVCSQFNAVKEITIPEEAKSAESISANQ